MSINKVNDAVVTEVIAINDTFHIIVRKLNKMSYGFNLDRNTITYDQNGLPSGDTIPICKAAGLKRDRDRIIQFLTEVASVYHSSGEGKSNQYSGTEIGKVFAKHNYKWNGLGF